jgi:hypothetical protein
MTLLDRFRTQARDKHPDPAVRLAFVGEIPIDDRDTLAAVAREDDDPRVRKAAVAKLMAPSVLASIARDDHDEAVRSQALSMLRDIALEAFEDAGQAESLEAVDALSDVRIIGQIAKTAVREPVALRAVSRIADTHVLGSVARHAVVEAVRSAALDALRARNERGEILSVAMNSDFKETALAAMEGFADRETLDLVIARGRNKSAVKRARALVRAMDEEAARDAAEAAAEGTARLIQPHPAVAEPIGETASPPHGDPLAAALVTADAATDADAGPGAEDATASAIDAATAAAQEAAAREAALDNARRTARLGELVEMAVATAASGDLALARRKFGAVAREWHDVSTGLHVDPVLLSRFTEIERQFAAREQEAHDTDVRLRREALARIAALLNRVEPVLAKEDLTLKAAERALRDVKEVVAAVPPLPSKADFDEISKRLKAAQAALGLKVQELREADDWRRFANVSIQEQLCAKMEALRGVEDPETAAHEVRELQQQWKAAADVPRGQAEALWRRFKAAHDEVWAQCQARFAAQAEERAANLAKKIALCEAAEAQAESTSWVQTAEAIKKLQAEWKAIGPVPRGKEKATWDRFRGACDRFFTRRHEDFAQRKATWAENLAKKDALCARAEALAESSEWDAAAAELRKLQAEWKTIGPVKKSKSEAVWQRFRGACDRFFARYASRHDTARAERVAAREALCAELEACAARDDVPDAAGAPPDLAATVRGVRARWQQELASRGVDPDRARALDQRFSAALNAVLSRWPASFAGSDLDPDANRKRMESLVKRVEALAASFAGQASVDENLSPTVRLAAMLKEALAANTIGGKVSDDSRFRAAAEEARQAQASWSRIGLVAEDVRAQLTARFQKALRTIQERTNRGR